MTFLNNMNKINVKHMLLGILLALAEVMSVHAQTIQELVESYNLGAGYAQLLNIATTSDLSAAQYKVNNGDLIQRIQIVRFPFQKQGFAFSKRADVVWRFKANHSKTAVNFPVANLSAGSGNIDSEWGIYGVSTGVGAKVNLGRGLVINSAVDFGISNLKNSAKYDGVTSFLRPSLDNLLFNWSTQAWMITPNVGLSWEKPVNADSVNITTHVSWNEIQSFSESNSALEFKEAAGIYSVQAKYNVQPSSKLLHRPFHITVFTSYVGFFGENRQQLGFSSVSELGLGFDVSLFKIKRYRIHLRSAMSYLFGSNVEGWAASLALPFE